MSYSGGIIKAPVTISDIRTAFVNSSRNLGYLYANGQINKWAKFKPVKHAANANLTINQRQASNQGFVRDNSNSSMSRAEAYMALASARANNADWVYERPTGGLGVSPFRMLDDAGNPLSVNGYNVNAGNPWLFDSSHGFRTYGTPTGSTYTIECRLNYGNNEIKFTELYDYANESGVTWYYGVAFTRSDVTPTSSNTSFAYLTKTAGGSAKLSLNDTVAGAASYHSGFFDISVTVGQSVQMYGCLCLVAVDNYTQGIRRYVYLPIGITHFIDITPTEAKTEITWLPAAIANGVIFNINTYSGSPRVERFGLRFLFQTTEQYVSATTCVFRARFYQWNGYAYQTLGETAELSITIPVGSSFTSIEVVEQQNPIPLPPLLTDMSNVYVSLEVKIGQHSSWWGMLTTPRGIPMSKITQETSARYTVTDVVNAAGADYNY